MRRSKLITRSEVLPVNLSAVKEHLGIYHDEKNHNLTILMSAATNIAEKFTGQIFRVGGDVYEQSLEEFPDRVQLDYSPATGITSVKYFDGAGTEQTLPTGSYEFVDFITPQQVVFKATVPATYTREDAVKIRYVAGFKLSSEVPTDVKSAILLITQYLYDNPGDAVRQMPTASEYILRNYKVL
jgi:uncharacterized phiE125 gp8 family phage protein